MTKFASTGSAPLTKQPAGDAYTGTLKHNLAHGGTVYRGAFSPDGQTLASIGWRSVVKLWDVQTGKLKRTTGYGDLAYAYSVGFSPDGNLMAVGNYNRLNFWDAYTDKNVRTIKGRVELIYIAAFSPDGKLIASAGQCPYTPNEPDDDFIEVWDVQTGSLRQTLTGVAPLIWYVAFSPDGKTLAARGSSGITLWDVQTGAVIRTFKGQATRESVALSPDGKTLAGGDGNIELWDVQTGSLMQTLSTRTNTQIAKGENDEVQSVAFSPDGKTLAGGCKDGTIKLWIIKS